MLIRLGVALLFNVLFVGAANILFLATLPSPSHHIWNGAVVNELARRGHNITVISPDIDKNPPPGVHYILIEDQYTDQNREFIKEMLAMKQAVDSTSEVYELFEISIEFCRGVKYYINSIRMNQTGKVKIVLFFCS